MATDVAGARVAPQIRLQLLDGFLLEVDGIFVQPLFSVQRLLAFLALFGPVARAMVAGSLWADSPEGHALASLRTTIWRANRVASGVVAAASARVALAKFVAVDVLEPNEESLARGRIGELLPGWYDDWVLFERERLRQLRLHLLEAEALRLSEERRYAAALQLALEAVRCEPLRESAHRAVIVVHLAEYNVVEARREFERFRQISVAELGVEPSPALAQLVKGVELHRGVDKLG